MIYYFILFFLFLGSYIKLNKSIKIITFIFLSIFLCFCYELGSDVKNYKEIFLSYDISNFLEFPYETGFILYTVIIKKILGFWGYYIFTKIIIIYFFYRVIKLLNLNDYFLYFLFYIQMGVYLFIDCPFRNLIAIGLGLLGVEFLLKEKILYFFIFSIIAISFHKSALILFVIPLLLNKIVLHRINRWDKKILITLIIIISILINYNIIINVLYIISPYVSVIQTRILKYSYKLSKLRGNGINIQMIEKSLIIFLAIWNNEKIIKRFKYAKEVLILSILFLLLYRVSNSIPILFRLQLFFRIFYLILIVYVYKILDNKVIKAGYKLFYFIYSLGSLYYILYKSTDILLPYKFYF